METLPLGTCAKCNGSFWRGFQEEERHFMEASEGLGNSQKAEVAWLERKGYAHTEVEVDISQWLQ